MEPLDGPPVSSPDPAISDSVEQLASSSTHAVTDMPFGSSPVQTRTTQCVEYQLNSCSLAVHVAVLHVRSTAVVCTAVVRTVQLLPFDA